MKCICIAHNFTENSFAAMSYNLSYKLASLGNRVLFISHRPRFEKPLKIPVNQGEILVYSWPSEKRPTNFKSFLWYLKLYLKFKPSITIGHFVGSNITGAVSKILSLFKNTTIVYYHTLSSQINTDNNSKSIIQQFRFIRKKIFYEIFCDSIICPSPLAKIDLHKTYFTKKGVVIVNPMLDRKINEVADKSKSNYTISYLGRIDKSKNVEFLVFAFIEFKMKNPTIPLKLRIAGAGSESKKIKEITNKYQFIEYLGFLPYTEIDKFIQSSDFMIIPSLHDNLPTVGLESLMNGTPLLLSNQTGLAFFLTDSYDSFIFEPTKDGILNVLERATKDFETINSEGSSIALGSGAHQSIGSSLLNQGKIPRL